MMTLSKRAQLWLRLVHRNGGLVLSLLLLLLVVSGVLLNHANFFSLQSHDVPGFIADRYYGDVEAEAVTGFHLADHWVYTRGGTIYVDQVAVDYCSTGMVGAVALGDIIIAACADELLLVTGSGQLVERLGNVHGVPAGIQALGEIQGQLLLATTEGQFAFDSTALLATPYPGEFATTHPEAVPGDVLVAASISWEQFILDVHSGRYFGEVGVWLLDFVGVCLLLLALSGITLALIPKRSEDDSG
jgi:hypothetical protein